MDVCHALLNKSSFKFAASQSCSPWVLKCFVVGFGIIFLTFSAAFRAVLPNQGSVFRVSEFLDAGSILCVSFYRSLESNVDLIV